MTIMLMGDRECLGRVPGRCWEGAGRVLEVGVGRGSGLYLPIADVPV